MLKTFVGVPIDDTLWNDLAHMYPSSAYSKVGGAEYLTDINNGQVIRRLWRVFGPRGLGWGLDIQPLNIQIRDVIVKDKPQHEAIIILAKFWYAHQKDGGELDRAYIRTAGSSVNKDAGHALTGAMTGCIKKAISYLGHQNALYCGAVELKDIPKFPVDGAYMKSLVEEAEKLGGKEKDE